AGLGNPGPAYETTRHNVGFLAIDRMVDEWSARGPDDSYEGELWETSVAGEKVYLIKPQTFMNNSGKCIAPLMRFYKCEPSDLIVVYDEVDLKPRTIRIKTGGGSAGHNGIRSIDQHLGTQDYHRVRIGVGKPSPLTQQGPRNTADWVLAQFGDEELEHLDLVLGRVAKAVERMIQGDITGAMGEYNRKPEGEE
ncbi:MAG TPA: aminoacyl-tRNA hydrolase, partial [Bdellovibrionota bacterium]|nr:aminoacyl-tRNA hydrolase [Bdellovibrionota bacterium]